MRILHFVSSLSINSGVMTVIMNYYRHIDRNQIQFDFIYYKSLEKSTTYQNEIDLLGGKTYIISKPSLSMYSLYNIVNFFKSHNGEFAAIHIHEVYLAFLLAPIARKYGLKVITHCHSTKFSDRLWPSIRNRLLCLGINHNADLRLACSKAAGVALYGKNLDFTVINNAIETDKFLFNPSKRNEIRKSLYIDDKIVIGHVGRFNECKNHRFLIRIFVELHKERRDACLLLVGEGPLIDDIHSMVDAYGLGDAVIFLGRRSDVSDLYNAMDLFVLPSLFEGLGIVLIEAQTNVLYCLASDTTPQEAALGKIKFVALSSGPECWSREILNALSFSHNIPCINAIKASGYDINMAARVLEERYFSLSHN